MMEDGKIDHAVAAFSLGRVTQGGVVEEPSYMTFGGVNHDQYVGDLYDFPIVSNHYWAPALT